MGLFDWFDYTLVVDWLYEFYHDGVRVSAQTATQAAQRLIRGVASYVIPKARAPPK